MVKVLYSGFTVAELILMECSSVFLEPIFKMEAILANLSLSADSWMAGIPIGLLL